jgi:selenide,water dikinase
VVWDQGVSEEGRVVLCDAQTSGGLLIAVPHERLEALMGALTDRGVDGARIGELVPDPSGRIWVWP